MVDANHSNNEETTSLAALNITEKVTSLARLMSGNDLKNQGSQDIQVNKNQLLQKMLTDDE